MRLEEVAQQCRAAGSPQVLTSICDLSLESECIRAVGNTIAHFHGLDVFVNSAGRVKVSEGKFEDDSIDDYDMCMAINTRSPYILTKLCIPHLRKSKGNIVYVSSIYGIRPSPGSTVAYGISKSAVDGMTRTLAMSEGENGVRVNSINPGFVRTRMMMNAGITDESTDDGAWSNMDKLTLRGKIADPEEIAATIVFLASNLSSYTTGQNMIVDGGSTIKKNIA